MRNVSPKMRQVVDWSAAVWAGIVAGLVFMLLNLYVTPYVLGGNAWVMVRLFASVILGQGILAPPASFDLAAIVAALVAHFTLSVAFALLLAYIIHRGGLITGVLGGALFGMALYFINFYTLTWFFPWFFALKSNIMLGTHLLFGALAGGTYEVLEVEEFVPIDDQ